MIKYLIPFITSFALTVILITVGSYLAGKIKWQGRRSERHIHKKGVFRIGGIVMILVFNLVTILNPDLVFTPELLGMMFGTLIILAVGVRDDIKEVFWKTQFLFQVMISILVFVVGVRIYYVSNPLTGGIINLDAGFGIIFSIAIVIFWIVLMINSINWLDGIDGLSGGVTFIGAMTVFFLSLKPEVNQPPVAIVSVILAGSVLGFIIYNFNPSRVIAGTAGSMFMGFSLAVLAIFSGTKIATAILVMALPIIDFLWVIGERVRERESIFKPDRRHLHYKLLELGWSQKKITLYFYAVTIIIAIIALNTRMIGKTITLSATFGVLLIILIWINRKIKNQSQV